MGGGNKCGIPSLNYMQLQFKRVKEKGPFHYRTLRTFRYNFHKHIVFKLQLNAFRKIYLKSKLGTIVPLNLLSFAHQSYNFFGTLKAPPNSSSLWATHEKEVLLPISLKGSSGILFLFDIKHRLNLWNYDFPEKQTRLWWIESLLDWRGQQSDECCRPSLLDANFVWK